MKRTIGIVGAGVGGLHLALYLQKHGIDTTIITDRAPDEYRHSRLLNTVAHHSVTIARETYLGIEHWSDPKLFYAYHDHFFNFPQPLRFRGDFTNPSRAVDYRIYLPTLMQDFARRGGKIEIRRIEEKDIAALVSRFDLLVVSTGKGALGEMFTYRPEHSPYSQPQRRLCVGLYKGVRQPNPMNVTLSVSPGHGEMIVIPTVTFDGIANALLMENVPGGDMEELATLNYEQDRKHYLQTLLGKLEKHHPTTYDRIDTATFDLAQPQDLLQGGVVPTVRNTTVQFDGGKCAIALGDLHSVVDPMMGQGANMASYAAFVLGEEIVNADALDMPLLRKGRSAPAGPRARRLALDQPDARSAHRGDGRAARHDGPEQDAGRRIHREFQLSRTPVGPRRDAGAHSRVAESCIFRAGRNSSRVADR